VKDTAGQRGFVPAPSRFFADVVAVHNQVDFVSVQILGREEQGRIGHDGGDSSDGTHHVYALLHAAHRLPLVTQHCIVGVDADHQLDVPSGMQRRAKFFGLSQKGRMASVEEVGHHVHVDADASRKSLSVGHPSHFRDPGDFVARTPGRVPRRASVLRRVWSPLKQTRASLKRYASWNQYASCTSAHAPKRPLGTLDADAREPVFDWCRLCMVVVSCMGHILACLGPDLLPANPTLDEWDDGNSPLFLRVASALRPYCIPLISLTSGFALGLQGRRADVPKSALSAFAILAAGIAGNAFQWLLSPRDGSCSVWSPCEGQGLLFSFTFCPDSSLILVLVYQLWSTLMLSAFLFCGAPLLGSTGQSLHHSMLRAPLSLVMAAVVGGSRGRALVVVLGLESCVAALMLAALRWPEACHIYAYAVAVCALAEVTVPFPGAAAFGAPFLSFVVLFFHKFFVLGWLFGLARAAGRPRARVMSRVWPLIGIFWLMVLPSTNWVRRGNLTYLYLLDARRRALYVLPALASAFGLERLANSRDLRVLSCPRSACDMGFALYISHPCVMSLYWQANSSAGVLDTFAWCVLVACVYPCLRRARPLRKSVAQEH